MFHGEVGYKQWSSTVHARGKRKETVLTGAYAVVHLSTGRFIVGHSKNVSADVDRWIEILKGGKSPFKLFNKLCDMDPDLELLEWAVPLKEAKAIEGRIRKAVTPRWLLLN